MHLVWTVRRETEPRDSEAAVSSSFVQCSQAAEHSAQHLEADGIGGLRTFTGSRMRCGAHQ
jgi:hypothetical protein